MDGFYTSPEEKEEKKAVTNRWTCKTCKLFKNSSNPKLEPTGQYKKKIMVIGSGYAKPTWEKKNEVLAPEEYFKTEPGKFLHWYFQKNGIVMERDCIYLNNLACSTDKKVSITHLGCCRQEKILPAIEKYKPRAIFVVGMNSIQSILAHRWGNEMGGMQRWRGCKIPDHDLDTWLFPIDDPADVKEGNNAGRVLWGNDIESALTTLEMVDFPKNPLDEIEVQYELDGDAVDVGKRAKEYCVGSKIISFDYETTGIRPYREDHRIVCVSVARSSKSVLTFMFPSDVNDTNLDGFVDVIRDRKIGKMAHNMTFEELWSRWCLGTQVLDWKFDTMLAAHVLDSRPMFTSLKFQSYIQFGVLGYEHENDVYKMITDSDSTDGFNSIEELIKDPECKKALLKYCAIDSCLQYKLAQVQAPVIGIDLGI